VAAQWSRACESTLGPPAFELWLVAVCYMAFSATKNLLDPTPVAEAMGNAWAIVRFEHAVGLGFEAGVQRELAQLSFGILKFLTYVYAVGMWLGLAGSAAILFVVDRAAYYWLRTVFLGTLVLALVVFLVYPVAPPRMLPGYGVVDMLALLGLDPFGNSGSILSYNRFAAMPSLHCAWALLVVFACFRMPWRVARPIGVAFAALIFAAVVATANHFTIDVIAGVVLVGVAFWVAKRVPFVNGARARA